jgi:hypothetical protein
MVKEFFLFENQISTFIYVITNEIFARYLSLVFDINRYYWILTKKVIKQKFFHYYNEDIWKIKSTIRMNGIFIYKYWPEAKYKLLFLLISVFVLFQYWSICLKACFSCCCCCFVSIKLFKKKSNERIFLFWSVYHFGIRYSWLFYIYLIKKNKFENLKNLRKEMLKLTKTKTKTKKFSFIWYHELYFNFLTFFVLVRVAIYIYISFNN